MKLALLRHGPTGWNALGRIQGHTDIPLSDEGLAKMRGLLPPLGFAQARAYASPMQRARQTAEALGLKNPILDARLMEQNWGRWEGLSRAEILARDGEDAFMRAGQKLEFRPPGGESTEELHNRVAAFLKDVGREERDAIAVTHLGVLRAAYVLATGWDMSQPMPPELDISKALILSLTREGIGAIAGLNVDLPIRT
ncbi:MAG TPA: histidine phosphatase family protein [Rhizomicrobium sp.]|nr:histidine phosphatase family protein [Rhizomicrobium sp.]